MKTPKYFRFNTMEIVHIHFMAIGVCLFSLLTPIAIHLFMWNVLDGVLRKVHCFATTTSTTTTRMCVWWNRFGYCISQKQLHAHDIHWRALCDYSWLCTVLFKPSSKSNGLIRNSSSLKHWLCNYFKQLKFGRESFFSPIFAILKRICIFQNKKINLQVSFEKPNQFKNWAFHNFGLNGELGISIQWTVFMKFVRFHRNLVYINRRKLNNYTE